MLSVQGLATAYGAIGALHDVSLEVRERELVTIVGANGAGKSTLLKSVVGLLRPRRGRVIFCGRDITGWTPDAVLREGLALVPERRRVFGPLSVLDNLVLGAYGRRGGVDAEQTLGRIYRLFPILRERRAQAAGTLSGGEQQMLAIGRALMAQPRLLLLDEPSLGLAPLVVREIFRLLATLRGEGTTILLVEQNARMALQAADRAYIMETGRVTREGRAAALLDDEELKAAYLGGARPVSPRASADG